MAGSRASFESATTQRSVYVVPNGIDEQQRRAAGPSISTRHGISTMLASPHSNAPLFSPVNFAQLNPLNASTSARTTTTRGRPAVPVALSTLPAVQKTDFEAYTKAILPEWQKYTNTISQSKGKQKEVPTTLPLLDSVPTLFMDESFNLTSPHTFNSVTEYESNAAGPSSPNSRKEGGGLGDLATNQMLPEKLSHYLDIVEQHLSREIANRSHSFFAALANLQQLHAQSATALQRAAALRQELSSVDKQTAKKGLLVVRHNYKRRRLQTLNKAVERVKEILKAVDDATELADHGEWEHALALVQEVERAYLPSTSRGDSSTFEIRLDRLHALQHLPGRLAGLRLTLGRSLEAEFVACLTHELESAMEQLPSDPPPLQDIGKPMEDLNSEFIIEKAKEAVRPLVRGLTACGQVNVEHALSNWREAVLGQVRHMIRANLPTSHELDEDDENSMAVKSAALATKIKALSSAEFLHVSIIVYRSLLRLLGVIKLHAETFSALVHDAASALQTKHSRAEGSELSESHNRQAVTSSETDNGKPSDESPSNRSAISTDLIETQALEVLHAAAELSNTRFSKVLSIRSDLTAQLSLSEFVALFTPTWAFILACEVASKRMIVGLRGVIIGQAKSWLQAFHQKKINESAKVVEEEQWAVVDVSPSEQRAVSLVIEGAMTDPTDLHINNDLSVASKTAQKQIDIDGRQFFAVSACLRCLTSLLDYLRVIINIPLLTTECMGRVIEYLKQFNSRTCQVVLGAGAMRSAGLKNITARHLALAAQSLSILINLIPYIREFLRRHLNAKQAVMLIEFDKLKRDYQEHQNEIYAKLVSIMGDRLNVHCKTLQAVDWSTVTKASKTGAQPYMEALVKETTTLHKVLAKYMPGQPLQLVMSQVLSAITMRMADELPRLTLDDEAAKAKVVQDAEFLTTKFGELKGLEGPVPGSVGPFVLFKGDVMPQSYVNNDWQDLVSLVEAVQTKEQLQRPLSSEEEASHVTANGDRLIADSESAQVPTTSTSDKAQPTSDAAQKIEAIEDASKPSLYTSPHIPEAPAMTQRQPSVSVRNRLGALFNRSPMVRRPSGGSIAEARSSVDLPLPSRQSLDVAAENEEAARPSLDQVPEAESTVEQQLAEKRVDSSYRFPAEAMEAGELLAGAVTEDSNTAAVAGDPALEEKSTSKDLPHVPPTDSDKSSLDPLTHSNQLQVEAPNISTVSSADDLALMTEDTTGLKAEQVKSDAGATEEEHFKTPPTSPSSRFASPITPIPPRTISLAIDEKTSDEVAAEQDTQKMSSMVTGPQQTEATRAVPKLPAIPVAIPKLPNLPTPQIPSNINVRNRLGALFSKGGNALRRVPSGTALNGTARSASAVVPPVSVSAEPNGENAHVNGHHQRSSVDSIDFDPPQKVNPTITVLAEVSSVGDNSLPEVSSQRGSFEAPSLNLASREATDRLESDIGKAIPAAIGQHEAKDRGEDPADVPLPKSPSLSDPPESPRSVE